MYGDGDPDDGLAAVERRGCYQTVVGGLYHQLAAAHLVQIRMTFSEHQSWTTNKVMKILRSSNLVTLVPAINHTIASLLHCHTEALPGGWRSFITN